MKLIRTEKVKMMNTIDNNIEAKGIEDREYSIEELLKMPSMDIYKYFLDQVLPNPAYYSTFLTELKESERYNVDYAFRATVDVVGFVLKTSYENITIQIPEAIELLDRTLTLELWYLVANAWNILGGVYRALRMQERSIECFSRVAEVEKQHNLSFLTFVAYFNLGVIYYELDLFDKALHYIKLSNTELLAHPPGGNRYYSKLFHNYAVMLQILCKLDNLEEAGEAYNALESISRDHLDTRYHYLFYQGQIFYNFLLYDKGVKTFEDCEQAFLSAKQYLSPENVMDYAAFIYSYIELCLSSKVKYEDFKSQIQEAENMLPTGHAALDCPLLGELKKYYYYTGDEAKLTEITKLYVDALEELVKQFREQQCHSVEVLETLLLNNETKSEVSSKNLELKLLFGEAMKAKGELQDAYQRIESISSLGRKLTSSLDLKGVIAYFNEILKNHVEMDAFALLMHDEEKKILRSIMIYQNGEMLPEISVHCDDEVSLIAKCYRTKSVVYWDETLERDIKRVYESNDIPMLSAVYLPLLVEDRVIGVYTLQHRDRGVYRDKLDFLQDLGPYVAIALNNAMKSWSLEKEIESHIVTQHKLQSANRSLEKISQRDGLTHINSRRFFEKKIMEMLAQAGEEGKSLTTLMIDIDDFKLYNDSYGHLEGDKALIAVARVFKVEMEKMGGLSARFGGEEFVGACQGLSYEQSYELAERIRRGVFELNIDHRASKFGRLSVSVGLSFGTAISVDDKSSLLKLADEMLYKAKRDGKNQVAIEYFQGA